MRKLRIGERYSTVNNKVILEIFQQDNYYILTSYMYNNTDRHNTMIVPGFFTV